MRRKILHLITSLSMGGAETLVTDYALKIDGDRFEFIIVTVSPSNNTFNEKNLKKNGVKVVFLGDKVVFPNSTNIVKRVINKIHRYILFRQVVNQENPDIIHTHLGTNNYLIPINTKKRNIKLFHTIHNEVNVLFKKMSRILPAKYCIKHKSMVPITLHSKMQKEANTFFNIDSSLVIPNAIDINRFSSLSVNSIEMRESLEISKDTFIVGHVGRFTEQKNHKFLIQIFASIKQKQSNAHLLLIGIGNLEDQVKEQVKQLGLQDSVSFLGNRSDIPELMSIMDAFVFPSLFEGFGNVLIEAQASGVKCVASDTIPKDAFITNLVTPLSLNDSTETWADIIINKKLPNEIVGDLQKHDINNVIKKLESIYKKSTDY